MSFIHSYKLQLSYTEHTDIGILLAMDEGVGYLDELNLVRLIFVVRSPPRPGRLNSTGVHLDLSLYLEFVIVSANIAVNTPLSLG